MAAAEELDIEDQEGAEAREGAEAEPATPEAASELLTAEDAAIVERAGRAASDLGPEGATAAAELKTGVKEEELRTMEMLAAAATEKGGLELDLSELGPVEPGLDLTAETGRAEVPPPPDSVMNAPSALDAFDAARKEQATREEQEARKRRAQEVAARQVEEWAEDERYDQLVRDAAAAMTELGLEDGTDIAAEIAETDRQMDRLLEKSEAPPPRPDILTDARDLMLLQRREQDAAEKMAGLEERYAALDSSDRAGRSALEREMEDLNARLESARSAKKDVLERHGGDAEDFSDRAREIADAMEELDKKQARLAEIERLKAEHKLSDREYESEKEYLEGDIGSLDDAMQTMSEKHYGEPAVDAGRAGRLRAEMADLRRRMRALETASPGDYKGGRREIDSLREDLRGQLEEKAGELHGDPETQRMLSDMRERAAKLKRLQEMETRIKGSVAEELDDERIDEMVEALGPEAAPTEEPEEIEITEDMMEPMTEEKPSSEGLAETAAVVAAAVETGRETEEADEQDDAEAEETAPAAKTEIKPAAKKSADDEDDSFILGPDKVEPLKQESPWEIFKSGLKDAWKEIWSKMPFGK